MNLRRLLACGLAAGTLAAGVGSTTLVASASTTPAGKPNVHHRHRCAPATPGTVPGKKCVQKHKPHPTHPAHP